jgi:hypothetical protein
VKIVAAAIDGVELRVKRPAPNDDAVAVVPRIWCWNSGGKDRPL